MISKYFFILLIIWCVPSTFFRNKFRKIVYQTDDWKINIKPLLPYEGDYILEGRFGNSIRFGATARSEVIPISQSNNWSTGTKGEIGDPITIIRNGQSVTLDNQGWVHTLENINTDPSSIYLTSNQIKYQSRYK